MCLVVNSIAHKQFEPFIAKEDLYVYKMVEEFDHENGTCLSFYKFAPQKIGELMISELQSSWGFFGEHRVEKGLHAYMFSKSGDSLMCFDGSLLVAKIPKGARYYIGISNDIVADQMILIEYLTEIKHALTINVLLDGEKINKLFLEKGYQIPNYINKQS